MDTVYIETTVVGNIAGRMHPNPNVASRQRMTRDWWATATSRYQIVTSRLTLDECGDGDSSAARERLEILRGIPLLDASNEAEGLAELLMARKAVPASEPRDAGFVPPVICTPEQLTVSEDDS